MKKVFILLSVLFINIHPSTDFQFLGDKDANDGLGKDFIEKLVNIFKVDIFFETGTYAGETAINAVPFFKEVYTVELHDGMFRAAKKRLLPYKNAFVYNGRSNEVIKEIVPNIEGEIIFWLDAHCCGKGTALSFNDPENPSAWTAIREELLAIKELNLKNCIILIDDLTAFGSEIAGKEYIGCWAYPTLNEVRNSLLKINPNFEMVILGNKLMAYDKLKYHPKFSDTVLACTKTRFYDGYNLSDNELIELEEKIMRASFGEKDIIARMYKNLTNRREPMFWTDLWYGLVELGSGNYSKAHEAFSKIKVRTRCCDKNGKSCLKIITYEHWRIDKYLAMCEEKLKQKF